MISVIIPTYNSEKYIVNCINSILSNTYTNYEIIVVDDGSTDNTISLINELKINNIKICRSNNKGPGSARNIGIKHSNGKYLFFLDSDDSINSNTFELLIKEMKDNDLVIGNYKIIYDNGDIEEFSTPLDSSFNSFFESVTIWNRLYLKSFIENNNIEFDNLYQGEDRLFLAKMYLANPKFKVVSKSIYNWIRHDTDSNSTLTHQTTKDRFYNQVDCMRKFLEVLMNNISKKDKELLLDHLRYSCIYLMEIYTSIDDKTCKPDKLYELANLLEFNKYKDLYKKIFNKEWSD